MPLFWLISIIFPASSESNFFVLFNYHHGALFSVNSICFYFCFSFTSSHSLKIFFSRKTFFCFYPFLSFFHSHQFSLYLIFQVHRRQDFGTSENDCSLNDNNDVALEHKRRRNTIFCIQREFPARMLPGPTSVNINFVTLTSTLRSDGGLITARAVIVGKGNSSF